MARVAAVMVVGLALAGLMLAGCAQSGGSTADSGNCAGCAQLMAKGEGWCAACDKGMFSGKMVKCKGCFKAKTGGPACGKCATK